MDTHGQGFIRALALTVAAMATSSVSQAQPQRTPEMLATLNDWVKETRQKK